MFFPSEKFTNFYINYSIIDSAGIIYYCQKEPHPRRFLGLESSFDGTMNGGGF